ncbi:hypothetical protein QQ045_010027 [Rhodiola kirilowii]
MSGKTWQEELVSLVEGFVKADVDGEMVPLKPEERRREVLVEESGSGVEESLKEQVEGFKPAKNGINIGLQCIAKHWVEGWTTISTCEQWAKDQWFEELKALATWDEKHSCNRFHQTQQSPFLFTARLLPLYFFHQRQPLRQIRNCSRSLFRTVTSSGRTRKLKEAHYALSGEYGGRVPQPVDFEVGLQIIVLNNITKLPKYAGSAATLVEGSKFHKLGS